MKKATILFALTFMAVCLMGTGAIAERSVSQSRDVISDSLYADDPLSGSIYFTEGFGVVLPCSQETDTSIGDYWDWALMDNTTSVAYLTFHIPQIPNGYWLQSAQLSIYCFGMMGNSVVGQYPIFDLQGNATNPPCILEHIDYGDQLDPSDLFPLQVFGQTELFDLLTPANSWTYVDVTEWALNDLGLGRDKAQFRIYLDGYSDWDNREDRIGTTTDSNVYNTHAPRLKYVLTDGTSNHDPELVDEPVEFQAYPNPFSSSVRIGYSIKEPEPVYISVYNLRGQHIRTLLDGAMPRGDHSVIWDGLDSSGMRTANGIYFIRVSSQSSPAITKRVIKVE